MKNKKNSCIVTDKEFHRLIAKKNIQKAVMVKNNQVFKYGYDK
ncbi:MAG: hypothetical protein VB082_07915 [Christensenella sp.]|nr:hypothetical protein [Christensenella sp.]